MYFVLTLWNTIVCFAIAMSLLRPDLKIRFSNSSNNETGKADKIFMEIWRDFFSPWEYSAKFPLESHKITEGGSCSFFMVRYIWVLCKKKDLLQIVEIKLNYHIINLFKILCSLSDMINSWLKRAAFDQIFSKNRLRLGPAPLRELKPPRSPIADCMYIRLLNHKWQTAHVYNQSTSYTKYGFVIVSHRWRHDPTRVGTFDC